MTGLTDPYLCDEDAVKFQDIVMQQADSLNRLSTAQARSIAWFLKRRRTPLPC